MTDLLRDPIWQFAGVLIGLVALFASVWIYVLQRQVKSLLCVLNVRRLIGLDFDIAGRLELLCDGKQRRHIHIVTVIFVNTGKVPVIRADFDKNIVLRVHGPDVEILGCAPAGASASSQNVNLDVRRDEVEIYPLLMNPNDAFELQMLVSDMTGTPEINSRIVGVSAIEITESAAPQVSTLDGLMMGGMGALMGVFASMAFEYGKAFAAGSLDGAFAAHRIDIGFLGITVLGGTACGLMLAHWLDDQRRRTSGQSK